MNLRKKLLLLLELIPLAVILNLVFWIIVNPNYRQFLMYWGSDSLYQHFRDFLSTLIESSIMVALACMFSGLLIDIFASRPHTLGNITLRKVSLLVVNLGISYLITLFLKLTNAGSISQAPSMFVYALSSTIVSDIYATYSFNKVLDEEKHARKTEQFARLTSQVDNHFMFNSLIVLRSLITADTVQDAQDYLAALLKCYKYVVLKNHNELSEISDEMSFIDSYMVMMSRPYPGVEINVDASISSMEGKIPTLCIQQSVENAIKHNARTAETPLQISIRKEGPVSISVSNNIIPRQGQYPSLGTSIKRLEEVYGMFGKTMKITNDGKTYKITLPIISETDESYID